MSTAAHQSEQVGLDWRREAISNRRAPSSPSCFSATPRRRRSRRRRRREARSSVRLLGAPRFARVGIDVAAARSTRRSVARDRVSTGASDTGWVRRLLGERAVELTEAGARGLTATLGLTGSSQEESR